MSLLDENLTFDRAAPIRVVFDSFESLIQQKMQEWLKPFLHFGPSVEIRLHFSALLGRKIIELPPSSWWQASVHRTLAVSLSKLSFK